jgi:CHASE2 domain-containing sensor protein
VLVVLVRRRRRLIVRLFLRRIVVWLFVRRGLRRRQRLMQPHHNPYAPPVQHGDVNPNADSADLFIETLPSTTLRAAMISLVATAILLVFTILQIVAVASYGTVGAVYLVILAVLAVAHLSLVFAVRRGSLIAAVVVFVMTPVTALSAAFMLLSIISLLPLTVMGLAVVNAVLVGVSWTNIRRIGIARDAMKKQDLG